MSKFKRTICLAVLLVSGFAGTLSAGEIIKINFQLAGAPVPEGYLPDTGLVFGDRGNGYSYGWNMDRTSQTRDRNSANAPDQRYDTLIHFVRDSGAVWEIALEPSVYRVFIVCGDPSNADSDNQIELEGQLLSLDPDGPDSFDEFEFMVTVTDGRLSWSQPTGSYVKPCFIEIESSRPVVKATRPDPKDGSLLAATWVSLGWTPGQLAVSHDVYVGETSDDVNNGTGGTFRGNQPASSALFFIGLGMPGDPYPAGLVPGTTYYWRIDEVNSADPNSPWKGDVWSFRVRPQKAYDPSPPDGAKYQDPVAVTLSWTAGLNAKLHYVYFGDNFETVSTGTVGTPTAAVTFAPAGPLALDKTYYWRVDEFDGAATNKGDVWSFSTTISGLGTAVAKRWNNISGTALSALKSDPRYPNNPDVVETVRRFAWDGPDTDNYGGRIEGWLYVPVTGDYTFWLNSDDNGELWLSTDDDGANTRVIARETSSTGLNVWNTGEEQSQPISLVGGQKYYIMALWKEGTGGDHCQVAWRGPGIATRTIIPGTNLSPYEPLSAYEPKPANGATGVKQAPALKWAPGLQAASHELYFGTDPNAVKNATKASPEYKGTRTLGAESYSPNPLAWEATYYWRIDEVNNTNPKSPWAGKVWSFTTANFAVIDDFEGYTDNDATKEAIWQTWIDGFGTTTNGAVVGNNLPPYAEQTIVHGGRQSMPLAYNNAGTARNSEAQLPLTYPRDWTAEGVMALSLWYHAEASNASERMYVAISNRTGTAAVVYNNAIQPTTIDVWRRWNIPIQAFADQGINLKDVDRIAIGFGTKGGTTPGGTGKMYIDDIGLYRTVPAAPEEIVLEAEAVTSITAPLTIRNDALASGGKCIGTDAGIGNESANPPATGVATYSITVQGGVYRLVGRVIIPSGDSFWLRIPDATTQTTNHTSGWVRWSDPANGDTWHWENVFSGDDAGQTVQFTLAAGTHTLEIARREDGALLDALLITTDIE